MTRHSRNSTANPVYTYHEQKRDSRTGNYGTIKLRCGKESIKDFDCCSLTLQPCKDPVVTPDGYLFDKAVILEYIIAKKKEIKQKLLDYEQRKIEFDKGSIYEREQATKRKNFAKSETDILPSKSLKLNDTSARRTIAPLSSQFIHIKLKDATGSQESPGGNDPASKDLASFWVPSLTPDTVGGTGPSTVPLAPERPSKHVTCPFSGNVLNLKSLLPVKFTRVKADKSEGSGPSGSYHYVCAVTGDVINNAVPCVVLRTSGHVVTAECVERIIKKDWTDPTNGASLTPDDIIPIERGGTGFADVPGTALEAKIQKPVLHG